MKLKTRFLLVAFGVIFFLIITPVLILFALGFKIDLKNRTVVKTGTIVVQTMPTRAQIFLDNFKQKGLSPSTIRFLLPKDYVIRVEKQDYQSWTKRLSVKSRLATWANQGREFITLFYTAPKFIKNFPAQFASISKEKKELLLVSNSKISLLDINSADLKSLTGIDIKIPITKISWQNGEDSFKYLSKLKTDNFSALQLNKIKKAETNGKISALILDGRLYYSGESLILNQITDKVADFTLENNNIWFIKDNVLQKYNADSATLETIIGNLPTATNTKIIRTSKYIFLQLDSALYMVNGPLQKIYDRVDDAYWVNEASELVMWNKNEIVLFDPQKLETNLILRSSSQVFTPQLNAYSGYLFFTNEGKIKALELDGRDHRNIYTIADAGESFVLSKDAKELFVQKNGQIEISEIR